MPRVPPIAKEQAPPEAVAFYEQDEATYGTVLHNTEIYAHSMPVLRAVKGFVAEFKDAQDLPMTLKALVRVRVAKLNGCPF